MEELRVGLGRWSTADDEPTRERIRRLSAERWSPHRIIEDVGVSHESCARC